MCDDPKPLCARIRARRFQHMDDIKKIALEERKGESDSGRISDLLPAVRAPQSRSALLYAAPTEALNMRF